MRKLLGVLLLCVSVAAVNVHAVVPPFKQCPDAKENPLPLPSSVLSVTSEVKPESLAAYEKQIFAFLDSAQYEKLGWCVDKGFRDTGPYLKGKSYGTHKSVLIYYSPGVMLWLTGQVKTIPDRSMIVKVQFDPPAARYETTPPDSPQKDWTVMIKDSRGSHDGWFWGEFYTGMPFDDHTYQKASSFPPGGYLYPNAGFGLYCLRCHASAARELTFASLTNIKGFPGVPLTFNVDDSWRTPAAASMFAHARFTGHAPAEQQPAPLPPVEEVNDQFLRTFPELAPIPTHLVQHIPNETWDLTPPPPGPKPQPFLTSTQCRLP